MSSPWDPAISQAMQRHGGSNRSIPKTASKIAPQEPSDGTVTPEPAQQPGKDADASVKPKRP